MSTATEARLIAYDTLIDALPALLDAPSRRALCDWLADRQVLHDGQEDPGAVLTDGLATELAIAATFRDLAERLECEKGKDGG